MERQEPVLLNISGPYGVGKDTMLNAILSTYGERVHRVHTTTTRPSDPAADPHYHSVSEEDLARTLSTGKWIVNRQSGGHAYGTSIDEIEREAGQGKICIHSVYPGPAGAGRLREEFGNRLISVALLATKGALEEQVQELRRRMIARGRDDIGTIDRRLAAQGGQIDYILQNAHIATPDGEMPVFDNVLINEKLDVAIADLLTIFRSRFKKL